MKLFILLFTIALVAAQGQNLRPVIGIFAQQTSTVTSTSVKIAANARNENSISYVRKINDADLSSYRLMIPASYVKWVGQGGGRVLPILLGRSTEYYKEVFNMTNGILFPGGNQGIDPDDIYTEEGQILWNLAKAANDNGDYYPIWGTCLGFEELSVLETGSGNVISLDVNATNLALPLDLTPDANSSRLFSSIDSNLIEALATENITMNSHGHGLLMSEYESNTNLSSFFQVLSTNVAPSNGAVFVSTMEALKYPFYGTQWHPEKNNFEWSLSAEYTNIPHSYNAILASQATATFFLQEARKSSHVFPEDEQDKLIYSAPLLYTGPDWIYEQVYVFDKKATTTSGSNNNRLKGYVRSLLPSILMSVRLVR